jgi:glycosyltransferase involved in cell wall biosynthesis
MDMTALHREAVRPAPVVDVVIPVYDEERDLEPSVRRLHAYLHRRFPFPARITVVDNASTDGTWAIARALERELPDIRALRLPEKGRGGALAFAWLDSDAEVVAYMDVDLSTDLDAFPKLVSAIVDEGYDLASGTRLGKGAETTRSLKREALSRGFVFLINTAFGTELRDTQCGFKAASRACAQRLLPMTIDTGWFWDTELLLLAAKGGWSIKYIPVRWIEDTDSRVKVVSTVTKDLKGLARMRRFDWSKARKTAVSA